MPDFVENEDDFIPIRDTARRIGDIDSFEGFVPDLPGDVDLADYTTVLAWCEAFSEFITAAGSRWAARPAVPAARRLSTRSRHTALVAAKTIGLDRGNGRACA